MIISLHLFDCAWFEGLETNLEESLNLCQKWTKFKLLTKEKKSNGREDQLRTKTLLFWLGAFFFLPQPTLALKYTDPSFCDITPSPLPSNCLDQSETSLCMSKATIGLQVTSPYRNSLKVRQSERGTSLKKNGRNLSNQSKPLCQPSSSWRPSLWCTRLTRWQAP